MKSLFKALLTLRLIILFGIIGGAMLWVGMSKLIGAQEKSPTAYTAVEEIDTDGPKWIGVEHCVLDIMESSFVPDYSTNGTEEIFIPIVSSDQTSTTNSFYLHTEDSSLVNPFQKLHKLNQEVNGAARDIELGKNDPEYLKFKKTTLEEQLTQLNKLKSELNLFIDNHPPIEMSIEGMLSSESEKSSFGYFEDDILIKHNALPASGFYTWFLVIVGGVLVLIVLFGFIGILLNSGKK
jgi:hypothetical protein